MSEQPERPVEVGNGRGVVIDTDIVELRAQMNIRTGEVVLLLAPESLMFFNNILSQVQYIALRNRILTELQRKATGVQPVQVMPKLEKL